MIGGFFWWNWLQYLALFVVSAASFVLPFKLKSNEEAALDNWLAETMESLPKGEG